jgi:hypothetical protein
MGWDVSLVHRLADAAETGQFEMRVAVDRRSNSVSS